MTLFSERAGYTPPRTVIQHETLDQPTRIALWNCIYMCNEYARVSGRPTAVRTVASSLWADFLNKPRDEEPDSSVVWSRIKNIVLASDWIDALNAVDAYVAHLGLFVRSIGPEVQQAAIRQLNEAFEHYLVDCRFIDKQLVQIGTATEVDAITDALTQTAEFGGARQSIKRAADLLSDRSNPDYLNSIKESISAVESVVVNVTGKKTLGAGLKELTDKGVSIHPALEQAWNKMYGWTSDADGIRHAAVEESESSQAMAKYMLVTCSAFVSYLIETGHKSELI